MLLPPRVLSAITPAILNFLMIPPFASAFTPGFPYGTEKVRGVNLGGWLVLEPWITPSLFDNTGNDKIIDEWTFGQLQDRTTATSKLQNHWNTFITESDFSAIAAAGLNHVRLPIGYWAFEVGPGEPYISGQLPYLTKAVNWAEKYGIKLIVDLHGAPGSQNGFDNSGQKRSPPGWHSNSTNIARTNAIIKTIASMYRNSASTVPTIAPLNEPAGYKDPGIITAARQLWYDSYGNIRYPFGTDQMSSTVVLIHDAFQSLGYWADFMPVGTPKYQGVAMDKHIYQMFSTEENQRTNAEHIANACAHDTELSSFHLWIVVGEWTPAATDCAKYLNGRGIGARYDGTMAGSPRVGSCTGLTGKSSGFSASYKTFLRQYWEAQTSTYEEGDGWIQWTWKTELTDEWSYQAGLAGGWIPKNPAERLFPNICG